MCILDVSSDLNDVGALAKLRRGTVPQRAAGRQRRLIYCENHTGIELRLIRGQEMCLLPGQCASPSHTTVSHIT